jgi:hypothetical protein
MSIHSLVFTGTHDSVGNEERPLEPVPTQLGPVLSLQAALSELEHQSVVVVNGARLAHTLRIGSESITSTTELCAAVRPITWGVELCELCRHIVDRQ